MVVSEHSLMRMSVAAELARRYQLDYRIMPVTSVSAAIESLSDLHDQGQSVALLLSDSATTTDTNRSVFSHSKTLFPEARRGLLIEWGAWSDPEAADTILTAMAGLQIDYYVVRPRRSPDEYFHRTIAEFLHEWEREQGNRERPVAVIGDDAVPRTHEIRHFLARSGVGFDSLNPQSPRAEALLEATAVTYTGAPLVKLATGVILQNPTNRQLAQARGFSTDLPTSSVDLAIVGAGPAGLAAAVYAASEGLNVLVLERDAVGGQAGSSSLIRNYLGFSRGISGSELAERAYQQAWVFGAKFAHTQEVTGMQITDTGFELQIADDRTVGTRAVVLASGVDYRRLSVPALTPFIGAAVFYGVSAIEAHSQRGRIVHVVGGGNSAGQAALQLARYASKVSLIVRGTTLADSMSQYLIDQLAIAQVQVLTRVRVADASGTVDPAGVHLEHLVLENVDSGEQIAEPSNAVFITIGATPRTDWVAQSVLRDKWGSIVTGADVLSEGGRRSWPYDRLPTTFESSVPGFYAVGDVRRGALRRVASAVGEGSVVVSAVHSHLSPR
jgi:thioredoxin reductase (NADPH)